MNKWLRRAVGTVGIAGGIWLLGSGTAHAADDATSVTDAQHLSGLLDSLFTPTGGPNNLALNLDKPSVPATAGPLSLTHGVTGHKAEALPELPLLGNLLPLGDLPSGLPLVGPLTHALPLDATSLPLIGDLTQALPLDVLDHPTGAVDAAQGLTDSLPVFDSLTSALPGGSDTGATGTTEDLPVVGSLPLVGSLPVVGGLLGGGGGLPVVGDLPVVGGLLGGGLPVVGSLPLVGSLPVVGGLLDQGSAPAQTESLPVVQTLPVVGDVLGGDSGLPVLGPLLSELPNGAGPLGDGEALPIFDSLPLVGSVD